MATRSDPGIVRLDPSSIQTIRGAFNAIEELVLNSRPDEQTFAINEIDPIAGIFDPVRLEMLRGLNETLADLLAQNASGEIRLDPSERETARQALGAAESLITTDAGQQRLDRIGANYSRQDISTLQDALGRIQPVREPADLAGTDIRYRLFLDFTDREPTSVDVSDWDLREFDADKWRRFRVCGSGQTPELQPIYAGYGALAAAADFTERKSRRERQDIAETMGQVIDELDFRAKDNRCYTGPDRFRLRIAGKRAADRYANTGSRESLRTLNEISRWTEYRVRAGLAEAR